jgi:hypothetical protein
MITFWLECHLIMKNCSPEMHQFDSADPVKYFLKKIFFLTQMFLQLALLPPLGHKKAIGTIGYPIASKLED